MECFLGGAVSDGASSIRWIEISLDGNTYSAKLWESLDQGSDEYLDVYSFEGANGEYDAPAQEYSSDSFEGLILVLREEHGDVVDNLVNFGIVQEEYSDYLRRGRVGS